MPADDSNRSPRIVVGIVSTNDIRHLDGCLRSLAASKYRDFQIIICENGGQAVFERVADTLRGFEFLSEVTPPHAEVMPAKQMRHEFLLGDARQKVSLINPGRNLGYAGGVNFCIAAAPPGSWDAIWVLNPDTFPHPNALAALVHHQRTGNYGIVGSRLLWADSGLVQTWGGLKWYSWLGRGAYLGLNSPGETIPDVAEIERSLAFISGASMYVSREYIETVGVMDEDFFVYCEDVDWCLRRGAFRLGYAHDSIVRHVGGGTSGKFSTSGSRFTVYLGIRNLILLARKRHGAAWPICAVIALNLALVFQLLRARSFRRLRFALDGWWAGVRGERGAPHFI
jgi:N-acetylglucosaminyl-diphospho-decaprenol L-rhamnosyltransferase